MAIDVEALVIDALLALVEEEGVPLERVTVKQLLQTSGVSRQTFYNHFLDKNDLIAKTYDKRVIGEFDVQELPASFDFRAAYIDSLKRMQSHDQFLRQALRMTGQNNLTEYALAHSRDFDLAWHQRQWGTDPMPEALRFATEYHAMASSYMTISWILSDYPVPAEELADLTVHMRSMGMDRLFAGATGGGNPYKD